MTSKKGSECLAEFWNAPHCKIVLFLGAKLKQSWFIDTFQYYIFTQCTYRCSQVDIPLYKTEVNIRIAAKV
jgi:hypothetical protein